MDGVAGYQAFETRWAFRRVSWSDGTAEVFLRRVDVQKCGHRERGFYSAMSRPPIERSAEEKARRSREVCERRAKRELRWACVSIRADRLLTLTYRQNVKDLARARDDFKRFVRLVRARYPGWQYVVVHEYQERGAVHFHAAVSGWQHVNYLRAMWQKASGDDGNIDVTAPRGRWGSRSEWKVGKLAAYLSKYLGKAWDSLPKGSHRFIASYERERPVIDRFWQDVDDGDLYQRAVRVAGGVDWCYISRDGAYFFVVGRAEPPPF